MDENEELMTLIRQEAERFSGHAMVSWKPTATSSRSAPADRELLGERLFEAEAFRKPKSYPRQRNYFGLYYFSQIGHHIWHESLNEANMFMLLDHTESIDGFASQPMEMVFADGRRHVPDAIALHSSMEQVVYDIKPASRITSRVIEQFAKTQAVCDRVGWRYVVLPGLPDQTLRNLTWFGQFRHPAFSPGQEAVDEILAALSEPVPFGEAAARLGQGSLPYGRATLAHLLWCRKVRVDMSRPIDDNSLVERTPHA